MDVVEVLDKLLKEPCTHILVLENQVFGSSHEGLKIKGVIGVMENHVKNIKSVTLSKIKIITEQDLKFPLLDKLVQEFIFLLHLGIETRWISSCGTWTRNSSNELVDGDLPGY